jgi:Urb2/Npa2 family
LTVEGTILAENVQESVKIAVKQLLLNLINATRTDSSDGAVLLLRWIEDKLASRNVSLSSTILLEGIMAACKEYLVNVSSMSSPSSSGEALAISLLACFETHAPSLSSLLPETAEKSFSNHQTVDSLASCAAYVINIRCLAPAAVAEKIEKVPKNGASNLVLPRMGEDLTAIADILTSSTINFAKTSIAGILRYLEAACLATGAMKPAATADHFASLLCLVLHILALLPVEIERIDPVRRIIPLSAAFPAARIASTSTSFTGKARAAALGALRTLLADSNSQQLRDVVAFVEKTLSTSFSSRSNPYLLPITELGLMALEGSRGKAALTTLAQRAERLASALTATLYNAACSLSLTDFASERSSNDAGMTSFAALYAAFLNTSPTAAAGDGDNNQSSSWTTRQISSTSNPSSTTSQVLACATALRALESIVARPKVFQLSSRHLARILNFIDILGNSTSSSGNVEIIDNSLLASFNNTTASLYANVCHLLTAFARHRESELGRCLPLFGRAVRALLTVLVKWEAKESSRGSDNVEVRVYCAEALAAVMAEIANLNVRNEWKNICKDVAIQASLLSSLIF